MSKPLKQNSRELFKATVSGAETPRPPIWIMRQAGRFLPEYRALKQKHTFVEITQTPELALEATLQPIRRFNFDCAIIFSDILVVAEALGFSYGFGDGSGIRLNKKIEHASDVKLAEDMAESVCERLGYVEKALRMLRRELPDKAIYGFCASPWTLACYMVEGESRPGFPRLAKFMEENPELFLRLMSALSRASANYARMQANAGIDAFQVFDSHADLTPAGRYWDLSGKWIPPIFDSLGSGVASVLFANGLSGRMAEAVRTGAMFYSLDASKRLSLVRRDFDVGLQGNLDPSFLSQSTAQEAADEARRIALDMLGKGRHIFNLSHGIRPDARIENVEAVCTAIKEL